jgi:hypothetical protein
MGGVYMKITKNTLKKLIKEEMALNETWPPGALGDEGEPRPKIPGPITSPKKQMADPVLVALKRIEGKLADLEEVIEEILHQTSKR